MEFIVKFGKRCYIFYSKSDITKACLIYTECKGDLDQFEDALEDAGIDFVYDLVH